MAVKKLIDVDGVPMTIVDAVSHLGVTRSCMSYYLRTGRYKEIMTADRLLDERIVLYREKHKITIGSNLREILRNMTEYLQETDVEGNFVEYVSMLPNERSARTLYNFSLVYGDLEGKKRYDECWRKNGEANAKHPIEFYKKKSIWSVVYWVDRGFTTDEAYGKIREHQSRNAIKANIDRRPESRTTSLEYWVNKGLSEEEAKKCLRNRQTTRKMPEHIKPLLHEYVVDVWYHTNKNMHLVKDIEIRSKDFHLDHIYSIRRGFADGVPATIIASVVNLRIIPQTVNNKKYSRCDITLKDLYERYESMVGDGNANIGCQEPS
jgi:hypothetical protein